MAKYMIHTCNDREWYVYKFLIPSMLEQGINAEDIITYVDSSRLGNLLSCMDSFDSTGNIHCSGIWHLQDDIIISSKFKELTEYYDTSGVVCGYCGTEDTHKHICGETTPKQMWYSFPCIRIPTHISYACSEWYFLFANRNPEYRLWVDAGKHDDSFFELYMQEYCHYLTVLNLKPNLVDHIDYLIGGSLINKIRSEPARSAYFEEQYLIDNLKKQLDKHYSI